MSTSPEVSEFRTLVQSKARRFVQQSLNGGLKVKAAVNNAVKEIHSKLGLKAPTIIWCQAPAQLVHLPLVFYILSTTDCAVWPELRRLVRRHLTDPSIEKLWCNLSEAIVAVDLNDGLPALGKVLDEQPQVES